MKKQFFNAIEKKVFTLFLSFLILASASVHVLAATGDGADNKKDALVSYKGVKDKLLVFSIEYKNESGEKYNVEIKSDADEVYYSKTYDAKTTSKDIYLSDVPEKCRLTFVIKSVGKLMKQSFEINPTVKTVADYEVTELR